MDKNILNFIVSLPYIHNRKLVADETTLFHLDTSRDRRARGSAANKPDHEYDVKLSETHELRPMAVLL